MRKYFITMGVIIILIICLIIMYILLNKKANMTQINFQYTPVSEEKKAEIQIDNYSMFSRTYSGKVDNTYIYQKIKKLPNGVIERVYNDVKDLTDNQILNYYRNNKDIIESEFGITNTETFKTLVKSINKLKNTSLKCESCSINLLDYKEEDGYARFILDLKYDNNVTLKFNVEISLENKSLKPLVQFLPIV